MQIKNIGTKTNYLIILYGPKVRILNFGGIKDIIFFNRNQNQSHLFYVE